MRRLAASTLTLAMAAAGAMAQTQEPVPADTMADTMSAADLSAMRGNLIRTRDITAGAIYTTNEADDEGWDSASVYDAVGADWNEIGEIEDIVLSRDGQMIGIVGEVGGFLDIADKHVLIPVGDVSLVAVDDESYAYVTRLNEEQLEALPDVDEGFWE